MKESPVNEKYVKESNTEIIAKITHDDPLLSKEKKYIQMKHDIINFLIRHEEKTAIKPLEETENSEKSKFVSASKAQIKCKLHGEDFIIIDSTKFRVECSKCLDLGNGITNLQLIEEKVKTSIPKEEETSFEGLECYVHPDTISDFYCDDCKVFSCKVCFTNQHRTHSSNILSEIADKYKFYIKDIIESINALKPKLEESSRIIGDIDKQIKALRTDTLGSIYNTSNKINLIVNNKYHNFLCQFEGIFMGTDVDTESVVNRLESLSKTVNKYITELNEISNSINSKENSIDICIYIKSKHNRLNEIKNTIEGKKNFLFYKVNDTKNKVQAKIEEFNRQIENINKLIKIYQISVLSSINTGISSSSLRLRRFYNMKCNTKYFKTSSVQCQFSGSICLVGLGLCGLYSGINENNGKLNEKKLELMKSNKNFLRISISEIKNQEENIHENLLTEEHFVTSIINSNDPVISIYFNKAVILKAERRYLITCTNLNKDVLMPRWYGEVCKKLLTNKSQHVLCNTSGIGFTFCEALGVESDFDEYCSGILAEFIFSYI